MRAIGYVRVSTEEQAREGVSLEMQVERITAYCESQGWGPVEIIRDEGKSGKDLNRPGMNALLALTRMGHVDVVVVYKVDRLSRRQRDLWRLLEDEFEPVEVALQSVTEPFETRTPGGRAYLGMLGVFAQLERDTIAERVKDALAGKQSRGEWVGRPPLGYDRPNGDGRLQANQEELRRVQMVHELRGRGITLREVADEMNRQGENTKTGGRFHAMAVSRILRNPIYTEAVEWA